MSDIATNQRSKAVSRWIIAGVIMLLIQVILGGITRLTGSGLSITEWNIVTGTFPPLTELAWMVEFDKYRQTPQFQLLNTGFTLEDFKFIFFWEWLHRFWARLIGIVFLVGFIYLVARKKLKKEMQLPLIILFLLGAAQGLVGWIMVVSGLTGDEVYVKPTRLAMHFIFAMILIAYAFWFALQLRVKNHHIFTDAGLNKLSRWILGILSIQLIYGALMAGHKAASAAPTWPDINGDIIPSSMLKHRPWLINFLDNPITVHFMHRGLAYLLLGLTIYLSYRALKTGHSSALFARVKLIPLTLIFMQLVLGVLAVLSARSIIPNHWGIFEWMAQLHQIFGMLFMLSLLLFIYLARNSKARNIV